MRRRRWIALGRLLLLHQRRTPELLNANPQEQGSRDRNRNSPWEPAAGPGVAAATFSGSADAGQRGKHALFKSRIRAWIRIRRERRIEQPIEFVLIRHVASPDCGH
jgi:hypothetical protein